VNGIRVPLVLSLAGHGAFLAALILLATSPPLPLEAPAPRGIELTLAPPLPPQPPALTQPPPKTAPAARPEPPKPAPPNPAPLPPPVAAPPPAHAPAPVVTTPPRPPHKPIIRRMARPVLRRPPRRAQSEPIMPSPAPPLPAPAPPMPSSVPARLPAPLQPATAPTQVAVVTSGYRALLRDWLEAHKHYPEAARERGEEGWALLRFRVDRGGRVLDYALVRSSGHPDLDAAVAVMMRGAILPAFPPDMPQSSLTISVTIRFGLR
jgi:protein TonB